METPKKSEVEDSTPITSQERTETTEAVKAPECASLHHKSDEVFTEWLKSDVVKDRLSKSDARLCKNLTPIHSEFYISKDGTGKPLCIFEVLHDWASPSNYDKLMLKQLAETGKVKIHGYGVLYTTIQGRIDKFRVKKFTPHVRNVGVFTQDQFAGFLAATLNVLLRGIDYVKRRDFSG